MTCENVTINGDKGTPITAYVASRLVRALSGRGACPHLRAGASFYIETTRRLALTAISRSAPTSMSVRARANRTNVAAKLRADGGISDARWVGDTRPQ